MSRKKSKPKPKPNDLVQNHQTAKVLNLSPSTLEPQRAEGKETGGRQPQPTTKPSSPPLGLMIVDDRPGKPGHPLMAVRIDGDLPNEEGNLMMVTDLALPYLKHLRSLKITADDLWMLGGDLELDIIAADLQRLADDMELEATSDELRKTGDALESVAEDLREWADGVCEVHADKMRQLADDIEEAAGITGFLADEMDFTADALRRLTDEEALAASADKMRRAANAMKRESGELWPATLMRRLRKVSPYDLHAVHAVWAIADAMERDSKAKQREFNTGNWAVA